MASNITQRPNFKVIIGGSFILSLNAGFIGAIFIAGAQNAAITNVTGDIAKTGSLIAQARSFFIIIRMTFVWLAYMFGSSISAMVVSGTKQFELRRTFGWALLIESFLLFLSYSTIRTPEEDMLEPRWYISEYFGAMACGLQNALCTSYSGAVIRTTHFTGVTTDIGIAIGQEIRIRVILPFRAELGEWWRKPHWWTRSKKAKDAYGALTEENVRLRDMRGSVQSSAETVTENTAINKTSDTNPIVVHTSDGATNKINVITSTATTAAVAVPAQPSQAPTQQPASQETSLLWRLKVLIPLLTGYLIGVILGSLAFVRFGNKTLLGPSIFICVVGTLYVIYTTRNRLSKTKMQLKAATDTYIMPILRRKRDIQSTNTDNNSVSLNAVAETKE